MSALRLKTERNPGLLIVDYLELMPRCRHTNSRQQEISDIVLSPKCPAKELEIPVVALMQLTKKVDTRSDQRPILADLRDNGTIEQEADVIMFIYRDDVYKFKLSERPLKGNVKIILAKQQSGSAVSAQLTFLAPYAAVVEGPNR